MGWKRRLAQRGRRCGPAGLAAPTATSQLVSHDGACSSSCFCDRRRRLARLWNTTTAGVVERTPAGLLIHAAGQAACPNGVRLGGREVSRRVAIRIGAVVRVDRGLDSGAARAGIADGYVALETASGYGGEADRRTSSSSFGVFLPFLCVRCMIVCISNPFEVVGRWVWPAPEHAKKPAVRPTRPPHRCCVSQGTSACSHIPIRSPCTHHLHNPFPLSARALCSVTLPITLGGSVLVSLNFCCSNKSFRPAPRGRQTQNPLLDQSKLT